MVTGFQSFLRTVAKHKKATQCAKETSPTWLMPPTKAPPMAPDMHPNHHFHRL